MKYYLLICSIFCTNICLSQISFTSGKKLVDNVKLVFSDSSPFAVIEYDLKGKGKRLYEVNVRIEKINGAAINVKYANGDIGKGIVKGKKKIEWSYHSDDIKKEDIKDIYVEAMAQYDVEALLLSGKWLNLNELRKFNDINLHKGFYLTHISHLLRDSGKEIKILNENKKLIKLSVENYPSHAIQYYSSEDFYLRDAWRVDNGIRKSKIFYIAVMSLDDKYFVFVCEHTEKRRATFTLLKKPYDDFLLTFPKLYEKKRELIDVLLEAKDL